MQFVSWDKRFVDPIAVPGRKPLVTLRDAATYITKLPHGRTRCRRMAGRDGVRGSDGLHQLWVHFQTSTHPTTRSAFGGG